ncbi:MAG: DNA-3-methyladenine glycosylase family protein [Thermoprotei archaeon]
MDTPQVELDIYSTLESGQTFSWYRGKSGCYHSVVGGEEVLACPGRVPDWDDAYEIFRLGDDLKEIYSKIDKDGFIHRAILSLEGMRVIKSDPWETTVSFMASVHNTVREIRSSLLRMRMAVGAPVKTNYSDDLGFELRAFPTPSQLSSLSEAELLAFGLGFRAKNILNFAKGVQKGDFDPYAISRMGYDRAKQYLMEIKGIGPKVADCVLLFAGGYMQAFPVDVWIRKVVGKVYLHDDDPDEKKVANFGSFYFYPYAGYAQEYIYAYSRGIRASQPGQPQGPRVPP